MRWSPTDSWLLAIDRIYDTGTGDFVRERPFEPSIWSPDGAWMLGARPEEQPAACFVRGQREPLPMALPARYKGSHFKSYSWSRDGVISGSIRANAVLRWDAATGHLLGATEGVPPGDLSPDGRLLAAHSVSDERCPRRRVFDFPPHFGTQHAVTIWNASSGEPLLTTLFLGDGQRLRIDPGGHHRFETALEVKLSHPLFHVVQTESGQESLTPKAFAERYGWRNDPEQVRLAIEGQSKRVGDGAAPAEAISTD